MSIGIRLKSTNGTNITLCDDSTMDLATLYHLIALMSADSTTDTKINFKIVIEEEEK